MANNLEDRDACLIYGANDDGSVCGIENTERPRYKTADIIKFLRDKPFAGGYIPQVEVLSLIHIWWICFRLRGIQNVW